MLFFSFSKRDAWIPQDRPDESVLSTEIFSRSFFDSYGLISLYIEGSLNCRVPCLCFFSPTNTLKFFSMEVFFPINIILGNLEFKVALTLKYDIEIMLHTFSWPAKFLMLTAATFALHFRPAYWIFNLNTGAFLAWCSLFMSNPYPPWMVYYIYLHILPTGLS